MTRREWGFFLIGLGAGLILSAAAVLLEFVLWFHHMFIIGFHGSPGSILVAVPFLLVLLGLVLLRRRS